ncbi:DUF2911 domain-containing protein [Roseivirga misakiensis]|uniref:DUF2911 domain-containing protein n=1 Tax=Roseivirga misakiensis TaxID=1563681 RepID=A0A1E5T699_9BACT|nr:DUF2911 domain-containing protein [Roseivirga misakiensis]OEK06912.1 hypothetical protein BFP71_04455 [Roseivirga misakiensis]
MSRRLTVIFGSIIVILLAIIAIQQYQLYQTKQYSPESTSQFTNSEVNIRVTYSRPSKNGRVIFGDLVPFGKWWRTGANETTEIELSKDILFSNNQLLPAGNYSLVTIPNKEEWTVIFNTEIPDWGTDYYPEFDVARVPGKVENLPDVVELFTIDFTENNGTPVLIFAWDDTKVTVPFTVQ